MGSDQENSRYSKLCNLAPIGFCAIAQNGFLIAANAYFLNLFQVRGKGLSNLAFATFIFPADLDVYQKFKSQVSNSNLSEDLRMLKSDGTKI